MRQKMGALLRTIRATVRAVLRLKRAERVKEKQEQEEMLIRKRKEEDWIADERAREKFERAYRQCSAYGKDTQKAATANSYRQRNGR